MINVKMLLNLRTNEVISLAHKAGQKGLRDTVVKIANDAIKPPSPVLTGNNRRSIFYGVSGMGHNQSSRDGKKPDDTWTGEDRSIIDDSKLQGAVYTTSGYGGWLEVGTRRRAATPYIRPAYDRHIGGLPKNIENHFKEL